MMESSRVHTRRMWTLIAVVSMELPCVSLRARSPISTWTTLWFHQHLRAGLRQNKSNFVLFGLGLWRTRDPARERELARVESLDFFFSLDRPRSSPLEFMEARFVPEALAIEVFEESNPLVPLVEFVSSSSLRWDEVLLLFKRASVNENITVLSGSRDRWPHSSS